jgi:hypothetical protein
MRKFIATAALTLAFMGAGVAAASATDERPPVTIVAWTVPGGEGSIWNPPQTLFAYAELAEPNLNALDDQLLCGTTYQVDQYNTGTVTDSLIAGGILYGPSNPPEALIHGGSGTAWKVLTTPPCVENPEPEPLSGEDVSTSIDCESDSVVSTTISWTQGWVADDSETGWSLGEKVYGEPVESSAPADDVQCPPMLANTGSGVDLWGLLVGLVLVVVGGVALILVPKKL